MSEGLFYFLWIIQFFAIFIVFDQSARQLLRPDYSGDSWNLKAIFAIAIIGIALTIYLRNWWPYTAVIAVFGLISGFGFVNALIWVTSFFKKGN